MAAHVASVVSGGYVMPPHAGIVSPAAIQSSQYLNANSSNQTQANVSLSPILPLTVAIGAVGLLTLTAFGIDTLRRSMHAAQQPTPNSESMCYADAAEAIIDGRRTYTKPDVARILLKLCVDKFKTEGSEKRNGAAKFFTSDADLMAAACESVHKSLEHGLSPNKMVRFLNHQRAELEKSGSSLAPQDQEVFDRDLLREFDAHRVRHANAAHIDAAMLFPCEDVKHFVLLYFHTLAGARSGKTRASAHYIAVKHRDGAWNIYDKKDQKINGRKLIDGAPTRAGAVSAVSAFSQQKYSTTEDVHLTVISQKPTSVRPAH